VSEKQIIILGTGGNCIDILDTINDINASLGSVKYNCIGFLDDNTEKWGKSIWGIKVLGGLQSAINYKNAYFVNGIGSSQNFTKKEKIIRSTGLKDEQFETIIHPTASVSKSAVIGPGTVVFQNVTITSNVKIGEHVIILPNSVISHDNVIGSYSCITGGVCISGEVVIGKACYLGSNSTFRERIRIGDFSLIAMGSNVLKDVPPNSTLMGNPARIVK
jgi:sugar O-acyltransferase (sialic acid O-acetyltransferase NeuD family)